MPKIIINEEEKVSSAALDITENVVFVPVLTQNSERFGKVKLYETAKDFKSDFGGAHVVKLDDINDRSFVMAAQCLNLGLKVLAYGVSASDFNSTTGSTSSTTQTFTTTSPFVIGQTKLDHPYGAESISLFSGESQVSTFNKNYSGAVSMSSSATSLPETTLSVFSGASYIADSIKFFNSSGSEISAATASVSISGTTATINATFDPAVIITNLSLMAQVGFTATADEDGVVLLDPEFNSDTDRISTIDSVTYEYHQDADVQATSIMQKALSDALDLISSKNIYNVKFITGGGYECLENGLENAAKSRMDCLALLDPAIDETVENVIKDQNKIASDKNKWSAIFMPWCAFNLSEDIVGKADVEYILPGSAAYLFAYGRSVQSNANWFAASGVSRGAIPNLIQPLQEITEAKMHALQGDIGDVTGYINPIMQVGSYGYRIWGNRTCTAPNDNSYFKFLNVRMLLCDIHKTLYSASLRSTFEPNDDVTWINFKTMCSGTLDKMTSGRGLNWYRWRRENTEAKATIKAVLTISPIEAVENFDLTIYLTDQEVEVVE